MDPCIYKLINTFSTADKGISKVGEAIKKKKQKKKKFKNLFSAGFAPVPSNSIYQHRGKYNVCRSNRRAT